MTADHPFVQIDYESLGLSPRDEVVDYCQTCGAHYEEHPEPTDDEIRDFLLGLPDPRRRP